MRKFILLLYLLLVSCTFGFSQTLTDAQREKAESFVRKYFSLLSQYAEQPMGASSLNIRNEIVLMFENMYNAPVYNDLQAFKQKTNLGASCTIDDYLLSFGVLNEVDNLTFHITYDSIVCHPILEPSYAEGYNDLNALVYVSKRIEGGGVSEKLTNVIRYNLNTDKISYVEKASFSTNEEDVNFLLKNHLGYSTAKLNEMASRCYQEQKYKKAYQLYEQAAIRDDMDAQFALAKMLYRQQGCEEYEDVVKEGMMKFWLSKIYYHNTDIVGETTESVFKMLSFIYGANYEDYLPIPMGKQPFNNGLMCVFDWKKERTGYLDMSGVKVIPIEYESFHCFSEGLVNVLKDEKYGFLNNKNAFIYDLAYPFYNGSAIVMQKEMIDNQIYKKYFLVNKEGKRISEIYDYMSHSIGNQLILASRGNKFGFVDREGKLRVPFIYENARSCNAYETAWVIINIVLFAKMGIGDL